MPRVRHHRGSVRGVWVAFLASLALFAVLVGVLIWHGKGESSTPLIIYCAAVMKAPVSAASEAYHKETGLEVQAQFGGSNTLLSNAQVSQRGDLFLPADESYIELARSKGLIAQVIPLARMHPVLAVRKGNPKAIHHLQDAMKEGVRISQANPDATAIGKVVRDALQQRGLWETFSRRITVQKPTVNDVAGDVKLGSADCAFVWDATVQQVEGLEAVRIDEVDGIVSTVSVAVLRSSARPEAALRFARYLGAGDRGLLHFKREGFEPVESHPWSPAAAESAHP